MTTETTPTVPNPLNTDPILTGDNPQKTVESPIVETPSPTAEPTPTPAPTAAPDASGDTNKATPEWAQKRINELTAKRYESERAATAAEDRAKAAEARAAALLEQVSKASVPTPGTSAPTPAPQLSEEEIERRATAKAQQIANQARFNEACDRVAKDGEKEYKDFGEAVKNLGMVGAVGTNVSSEFLETAIELESPHKVLHHLGMNPELAAKIVQMPPKKMALEMARIEAQLSKPAPAAPVSGAPAPIIPVAGGAKPGSPSLDDSNITSAEWFELRAKQIDERRSRYKR